MSKKVVIIGTVILVVVLGLVAGYFVFNKKGVSQNEFPSLENADSTSSTSQKFNENQESYEDESGYSFSYPQSITVKDVTPDDETYYSALELTKAGQTLKIDIKVGNTDPYKTNKSANFQAQQLSVG